MMPLLLWSRGWRSSPPPLPFFFFFFNKSQESKLTSKVNLQTKRTRSANPLTPSASDIIINLMIAVADQEEEEEETIMGY